jgi:tRNA dimethylallyltransferase
MKKVIILLGPTAVGKTAVSILLAKTFNTEIISADSMQIYKHMDIGTAKPSFTERQVVKHHMIDIVEPWDYYSTGEYINAVQPIIETLHGEDRSPLVVGGTGLYIKAMTRGIFKGPSADWDLRRSLLKRIAADNGMLYDYLKTVDPSAASRISPNDVRRIVRALEVCLKSGKSLSELHRSLTVPLPYDFIKIGLARDRRELYPMIEQRVEKMIETGLCEEVRLVLRLIENAARHDNELPSLQAIGYKEIALHLRGEISLDKAVRLIKKRSKEYAKRQFTWFRKEKGIQWIDITGLFDPQEIAEKVLHLLQ